ncbi:hypothetical protein M0804_011843 [Polistes exclamans]|nr:hypothetical protein M0804_011843 [Polistes exclamans]
MQDQFKKNPDRVARGLLMMTRESPLYTLAAEKNDKSKLKDVWCPVPQVEIKQVKVQLNFALGIDGVTA